MASEGSLLSLVSSVDQPTLGGEARGDKGEEGRGGGGEGGVGGGGGRGEDMPDSGGPEVVAPGGAGSASASPAPSRLRTEHQWGMVDKCEWAELSQSYSKDLNTCTSHVHSRGWHQLTVICSLTH